MRVRGTPLLMILSAVFAACASSPSDPLPSATDAGKKGTDSAAPGTDASVEAGDASGGSDGSSTEAAVEDSGEAEGGEVAEGGADTGTLDAATDAAPEADIPDGATMQNVMVVRVGDGSAALTSASTPIFLEAHNAVTGALVSTTPLPTAASGTQHALSLSGTATSEGALSLSNDGHFLVLAGYGVAPGTASVSSTSTSTVPRVVARIDAAGTVDTSTLLGTAYDGNSVRGATTSDGTGVWTAGNGTGANGGVQYQAFGMSTQPVQVLATPANARTVGIFAGQLYATSGSTGFNDVFSVGTGMPTTASATQTSVTPVAAGASPYGFAVFDLNAGVAGPDTVYVADDRSISSGGGVQKYTFDGSAWTLAATFKSGLSSGARSVAGVMLGSSVYLVVATAESPARLVSFTDDGSTPTALPLATAATNTVFRGVAFAPN